MAEQEACAEVVRSTESAAAEETTDAAERGESLLLPLLQGLLDGDSAAGGERLLAGLGAGDADVVADVRRALRRLRTALTDPATERHPRREALLALADRLEDALDASADRLDGCKRQLRTPRRRSRTLRHTVGVTREELEVARRLVDESDLDDLKTKSESQTPAKLATPPETITPEKEVKSEQKSEVKPVSYHEAVTGKKKLPPITHSVSFESSPVVNKDVKVVRRSEPVNKDKNLRHSIANGITDVPQHHREPFGQPRHQSVHQPQPTYQPQQPPSQAPRLHPQPIYQPSQAQPSQLFRRPSKEYIQPRVPVHISERNEDVLPPNYPEPIQIQTNCHSQAPAPAANGSKDNVFKRAPLYRPLPPGYNFAAAPPAEEAPRAVGRFNHNKRSRMKRANTIDIPKPLNFYRVESDTEDEASHGQRNSVEGPNVPSFQPKTDNDRKFLAFIQKNNAETSAPFSPAKAAVSQGQNWNSCFGNIKNAFESQSQDRSRSSSSSSARNFWKAADDQSVNPVKTPNYGPRLSRKSVQDLQQMHAYKASEQREPWSNEAKGDVVSASLTVTGPNHANGIIQAPAKPFIAKPIPVNQFSHAPMSAFKPPKKVTSPVVAQSAHVWSPPSYERNSSYERERLPPQTLPINDTYVPSKPVLKSPTTAPWMASNPDQPKRVLSLAASKFETNPPKIQPSPPYISAPPPFKPKTFTSFDNQNLPTQQYQNFPVKTIPIQNNLAAPQLVKKIDNMKQNYEDKKQPVQFPPTVDAQKLQIEFYEKQIAENAKRKPLMNGHTKKLPEGIVSQTVPQVYTVTNYTPAQVSTFVPLQQTPDIEKAKAHKVDYLPDVVLNEHNQYANDFVKSPSIQKSNYMTKPSYPSTRAGIHNGSSNYPTTPPGIQNGNSSPGQYLEPQYDGALSPGEYDPTEYHTVTRVMRGPQAQQATIKSGVTTRNGEAFRDTAAKSLKGALQKFSSPKSEVLNQIERKKREQRAPNGHVGGERFQVQPPQPQPQRMDNQQMYNQPVNMYRNNYNAPPTPPHDPKPLTKSVPIIKYNSVQTSPPARLHDSNSFDFRGRGGAYASRELVQSSESLDRSSKPPSPAVNKFKTSSPHSNCSTTPSPSALSKSESWHQLIERQNAAIASSPRASPRKVVSRAKSMHLLSVPKLFEAGIAHNQLSEKRKTVEAYFSGQASPNSLSKSNSQQTIPDTPPSGGQSPVSRSKQSVARSKTTEKRSFCLGRSRTMPTINDMKLLDESNADDAFEDLLRETFS